MRAAANPKSNVAGLANWLRTHPGPIYTSRAYPEFPGAVEFPLAEVMTKTGHGYFNSTVAYALAYALDLKITQGGPRRLELFGIGSDGAPWNQWPRKSDSVSCIAAVRKQKNSAS